MPFNGSLLPKIKMLIVKDKQLAAQPSTNHLSILSYSSLIDCIHCCRALDYATQY